MNNSVLSGRDPFNNLRTFRWLLVSCLFSGFWALFQMLIHGGSIDVLLTSRQWTLSFGLLVLLELFLLLLLSLSMTDSGQALIKRGLQKLGYLSRHQWLVWIWFGLSALAYSWLLLGGTLEVFSNITFRLSLLWLLVVPSSILFKSIWPGQNYWGIIAAATLWYEAIYTIITFLPSINTYPFSLNWSEGSNFYYASLFFSEKVYGIKTNFPLLNPTQHLLKSIPFLISGLPIWVHRAWDVILWLLIYAGVLLLLLRRLHLGDRFLKWLFLAFSFLFLIQGPAYYFLLLSLIPVIWGFNKDRFALSTLLIMLGSAWAGISRLNWIIVPSFIAVGFYLLEEKFADKSWFSYSLKPIIWVFAGTAAGSLAWFGYALLSRNPINQFGIFFGEEFLLYRLLPNPTFKLGILPAILLASMPLILLAGLHLYRSGNRYHPLRWIGTGFIALILFASGTVVSTKIGGGNNIHNFDAFLFMLLLVGSYVYFDKTSPDSNRGNKYGFQRTYNFLFALTLLLPLVFTLQDGSPLSLPSQGQINKALNAVDKHAGAAVSNGGVVLFISERQLLTFGAVQDIPLVPDNERLMIMEMAMAENDEYLDSFNEQIRNQDFALIISEPLNILYKGRDAAFGEENDVYVSKISEQLLCHYKAEITLPKVRLQLLKPRDIPHNCE